MFRLIGAIITLPFKLILLPFKIISILFNDSLNGLGKIFIIGITIIVGLVAIPYITMPLALFLFICSIGLKSEWNMLVLKCLKFWKLTTW